MTLAVGEKINSLTITGVMSGGKNVGKIWSVKCDCGKAKDISTSNLQRVKSCGCLQKERLLKMVEDKKKERIKLLEKYIGSVFGKMVIVGVQVKENGNVCFSCDCACGEKKDVYCGELLRGRHKSCGCSQGLALPKRQRGINILYAQYRYSAQKRGLPFEITLEELESITSRKCFYCNDLPSQYIHPDKEKNIYVYNGIDRMDNLQGYVLDNCVSCCKTCNIAKRTMSFDEFKAHISKIFINLTK